MTTYKLPPNDKNGNTPDGVAKIDGDVIVGIPFDPDNTCYQRYLVWLSEGNTPLPPDEPIQQNEQPSS